MARARRIVSAILALPLWIAPLSAQAPTGTIRGRVTDSANQQPLSGATVTVGSRGALTSEDGRYIITGVPVGNQTVRAVFLGYAEGVRTVTVASGQTAVLDLALETQAIGLNAVVVVGYGQQKAGNITGAVKQVTAAQFNTGVVASPQALIESKVAGVQVVDNNEPGGGLSIRVRGATSINASSEPLYVIDGLPVGSGAGGGLSAGRDPLNFLNPEEIESITVLKDASAAAIYGANAANGVVLITTKKGKQGTQIEYTGSVSGSTVTRTPSLLTTAQFRAAVMQYGNQSDKDQLLNASTDWFGLITRSALAQEHNLAMTGAGESMRYRLSLGYLNQDGVIRGSSTERMSIGLNYDQRFFSDRLNIQSSIKGARTNDQFTPGGVLSSAAQMGPTQPQMDPASPTGFYNWPGNKLTSADNPMEILALAADEGSTARSVGSVQASYNFPFLPALKATVNAGYDLTKAQRKTFNSGALHRQLVQGFTGNVSGRNQTQLNEILEAYLNYNGPLQALPGNIDLTGGYSYTFSHDDNPWYNLRDLSSSMLGLDGLPAARDVQTGMDVNESKLISFFGRVNYNVNDKYLLAASIRRDGSSRFGPDNAWGYFPSFSAAWRISQESLLKGITALSDLKLRASWGKTGNQAFANYQQYPTFSAGDAQTQAQLGNQFYTTIRPNAFDPNIKWETTSSWDVGLDYGFLAQRFSGSIDVYRKSTSDMIFTVGVPAGTNLADMMTTNIGSMQNEGVEASLSAKLLDGGKRGLSWTADFNAAANRNKLLTINPIVGPGQKILVGGIQGGVGNTIQVLTPGQPIYSFYTCPQYYQNGKPVEGKYVSLADTVATGCTDASRRPSEDPAPKWILGHTSTFGWRNFDASFTLRAYLGNYVYNNIASSYGTYSEVKLGAPYNLDSSVLTTGFQTQQLLSDYYVQDASFVRMDNATVGYSFTYADRPLRLFATVQNAFTLTGYDGVDPTSAAVGSGLNGIDNNIYPRSRTFTGGLSVRF